MFGKKTINTALSPNSSAWDSLGSMMGFLDLDNYFRFKKDLLMRLYLKKLIAEYFIEANTKKWSMDSDIEDLTQRTFLTESGRSALYLILKSLELQEGDEIILQGFTCMVVTNSIVWAGGKPIYVDIDQTYNLDPQLLEKKITHKTRAVIVQHTFGVPAQIETVKKICDKHKVLLIEDCAHALGAEYQGRKVGFWGDFAFYSMGRSKVISSVNGGVAICQNKKYLPKMLAEYSLWKEVSLKWALQSLFHPIASNIAKPTYDLLLGKVVMKASQKLGLINMEVSKEEKLGKRPNSFAKIFPEALADLAISQWKKLDKFNKKRKEIAEFYYHELKDLAGIKLINPAEQSGAIFLRYPIQVKNPKQLMMAAKKENIYLGDWYKTVIAPEDIDNRKSLYEAGSCPRAELVCQKVVNLPTHFSLSKKDLIRIVKIVKQYAGN